MNDTFVNAASVAALSEEIRKQCQESNDMLRSICKTMKECKPVFLPYSEQSDADRYMSEADDALREINNNLENISEAMMASGEVYASTAYSVRNRLNALRLIIQPLTESIVKDLIDE